MNTYLYIGGVNIDLFEDVPITIDYSLTDIMQPASRKVSHTKTIELPNTPNNASVFHQLFVINKDNSISGYDPNLRVVAFVQNGSGNLIEGYFQLTGIVKNGNDVKYQGVIYSDGKNLFSQMGDSFLQGNTNSSEDVDLSSGTSAVYYQYGSSYYGKTVANNFVASSDSVALGIIDSGTNTTNTTYPYYYVPYTNLRMAIKLKHIWDRIFTKYGCTYSSTFLNSSLFKAHVYLDTHKKANLTTAQYNQLYANVYYAADSAWLSTGNSIIYNTERVDVGNKYNPVTGVYSIASNRDYTIQVNNQVKGRITFTAPYTAVTNEDFFYNIIFNLRYNSGVIASSACYQKIVIPAGSYIIGQTIEFTISTPNLSALQLNYQSNSATSGSNYTTTISFSGTGAYPVTLSAKILAGSSMTIAPSNNSLGYNDLYSPDSVPASQHKQKDFIGDILRMFNLYVLFDGVNYIIEPRDSFFELGSVRDWTEKIDRSQTIEILPLGHLNWKQMQFVAKKDADYYSDTYFINNKEVYGQQNVLNQNEFITETKKVELTFAPPLTVSNAPNYPKLNHIYKLNNGVAEAIDGLPRYAYWGGWLEEDTCSHQMTSAFASSTDYNGYAYIGEYDNPISSTYSCLFGPPKQIYYQSFLPIGITDLDLYTNYYSNELNNQVSANAKLIRCNVLLQPIEINNLKLYDTVIVDGVRCIISKISDYNTTTIQPTQVELIQYVQ
jgi:hypothetical protein